MKNSESIQLVKEQLQIKSIELRKVTEDNATVTKKIKTLITDSQAGFKKLKTVISQKDSQIQNTLKEVRIVKDSLKLAKESANEKVIPQGIDPKIIKKIKELKVNSEKLKKELQGEQDFNKKFKKEKNTLIKELKRLKKEEGKVEELYKRIEKFKKELAKKQNMSSELDDTTKKLIQEKDELITKLKGVLAKGVDSTTMPEEIQADERFEGMQPAEIITLLKEDLDDLERQRKKLKKRFEMLTETNEELQTKLNLASEDKGGGQEVNTQTRSASSEEFGGGLEAFLITFADMVSLLLVIFVLMYSISDPNPEKFAEAMGSMQDTKMEVVSVNVRLDPKEMAMLDKIRAMVKDNVDPDQLIRGDTKTILFKIPSGDLFGPGKASLLPEAGNLIISTIAQEMEDGVKQVVIDGHTDNVPTRTKMFPSNWELSASRAASVARFIIKKMRYPSKLLVVTGYGSERPLQPNTSDDNRAANRRVEIKISKDKNVWAAQEKKRQDKIAQEKAKKENKK